MQLVVLAGGKGTRLGEAAEGRPKPLVDINGVPFLYLALQPFFQAGVSSVLVLAGQTTDPFERYLSGPFKLPVRQSFVEEKHALGTGGALLNARPHLEEEFVLVNGDTFFPVDLNDLLDYRPDVPVVMVTTRVADTGRYGAVESGSDGLVTKMLEKSLSGPGQINGGLYRMKKSVIDAMQPISEAVSLEHDVLPGLIAGRKVAAFLVSELFLDIGLPEDLEKARQLPGAGEGSPRD